MKVIFLREAIIELPFATGARIIRMSSSSATTKNNNNNIIYSLKSQFMTF
ncbi:MAG: hypothetical protein M3270_04470 [Thermoproteota archaeon]|nr:hypothetical protein [Thermoproteota archaeon]